MIKWLNNSGQEVESNDNPATVKALKAAGWTLAEEAEQMEIEVEAPKKPKKKGNK